MASSKELAIIKQAKADYEKYKKLGRMDLAEAAHSRADKARGYITTTKVNPQGEYYQSVVSAAPPKPVAPIKPAIVRNAPAPTTITPEQKFSAGNAPKTNFQAVLPEYNMSLPGTGQAYAKILPDTRKKEIATGTQRFFEQAPTQAGFMQGFSLNNPKTTLEKKLGQTIDTSAAEQQTAYKIGEGLGIASQFAIPYAGASGAIGKGVTKLLPNAGKVAPILKSVATDLAVGLPLNVNYALNKQGLRGNEAAKSIAANTAIDLVTGGVIEAIGGIILRNGKKIASKADFEALTPQEQQEVRLMLTGPINEPQKLLTEGQNWGEPIRPDFYVNRSGVASPDASNVNVSGLLPAPSKEIKPDLMKVYHGTKSDINDIGQLIPGRQITDGGKTIPRVDGTIGNKSVGTNKIYVTDNPQVAMSYGKVLEGYLPGKVLDINKIANDYGEINPEYEELFSDYSTSPLLDARDRAVFRNAYLTGRVENFIVDMGHNINEYLKSKGFSAVSIPYIDDVQGPSHEIILLGGNNLKSAQQLAYDAAKGQKEAPFTVTPGEVRGGQFGSVLQPAPIPRVVPKAQPIPQAPIQNVTTKTLKRNDVTLPDLPVRYNPDMKNEARNFTDHVEVGDKFNALDSEGQKAVMGHENAHNISNDYLFKKGYFTDILGNKAFGESKIAPDGRTYWEGIFGDVGATSVDETLTNTIAVYLRNPDWLKEMHPEAYDYIAEKVMKSAPTYKGKPRTLPQAPSKPVQPVLPKKGTEIPKEQAFVNSGDFGPNTVGAAQYNKSMEFPEFNIVSSKQKGGNIKGTLENIYTRTVDTNTPINKVNDTAYLHATNSKSVSGIVDHILTGYLPDKQGNKLGESFKETLKNNVPQDNEKEFWNYMLYRHNIGRAAQGKNIMTNLTAEMSQQEINAIERLHPEWRQKSNNVTKWIDDFMKEWGVKSGLISQESYDIMRKMYPDYIPTNRFFDELEKTGMHSGNASGFVDQTNIIKKATGSDRDIIDPKENIMNLVNRTVRTAKYNEVGQDILNAVRKNPDNPYVQLAKETDKGDNIVSVFENGQKVDLKVNDLNLLRSLESVHKANLGSLADVEAAARKVTNVYKGLITQKNPLFAVRNVVRDIPTYLINSEETNPIKSVGSLGKAYKEILTNGELLNRYKAVGGGRANFFAGDSARAAKNILKNPNPLARIVGGIEKFNNVLETAPRLAEFNNVLKKTGDVDKALYAANDVTTNFSRNGDITKSIDAGVPYLNAGVQGIDKFGRQLKRRPVATTARALAYVTGPVLVTQQINKDNPHYRQLDNRTKDNYFLFPNVFGPQDENGYSETFIKLPKTREFGALFGALAERLMRQDGTDRFEGLGSTFATNFAPTNPIENNILSPLLYNIPTNKDFAGRAIVPMSMTTDKRSPYLQYDETTSNIGKGIASEAKKIGVDLSPKQIDYIVRSYSGVLGQIGLPAATSGQGNPISKVLSRNFTADPLYSNDIQNNFYEALDKATQQKTDNNLVNGIPSDYVTPEEKRVSELTKASQAMSELRKQEKQAGLLPNGKAKDETLRQIRQQILDIAQRAPLDAQKVFEEYKETYIPEISGMSDKQKETYGQISKMFNISPKRYATTYDSIKDIESMKDDNGKAIYLSESYLKKRAIDEVNPGLTPAELRALYHAFDVSEKVWNYQ